MADSETYNFKFQQAANQAALRDAIIRSATRLLIENGPDGLSARQLAKEVGASTKVIYSHFGGMQGVVSAVYVQGFGQLIETLEAADNIDLSVQDRLAAVAIAYRQFARIYPDLFDLMFGPYAKWLASQDNGHQPTRQCIDLVTKIMLSGQVTHHIGPGDARALAHQFWAAMHGPVALEAASWPDPSAEKTFERIIGHAIADLSKG